MKSVAKPIENELAKPKWNYKLYLGLFGVSFVLHIVITLLTQQPGYIDAYYYYQIAANYHNGLGLNEISLWNYQLDSFQPGMGSNALLHPAFSYWLPLTSGLIIGSFAIFGVSFFAASLPFVLISALLPPVAYWAGQELFGTNQRRYSWVMALVMLFPGRYLVYFNTTDNFAPFALIVMVGLVAIYKGITQNPRWLWLAGALGGLAYLSRSEGILLLIVLVISFAWYRWKNRQEQTVKGNWLVLGGAVAVGLLIVLLWFVRNLFTFGSLIPGDSSHAIFLRDYNDLFSYSLPLNLNYYLNQQLPANNWGIGPIIGARVTAAWLDIVIFLVQGLFLLGPFALVGFFLVRRKAKPFSYQVFGIYFVLLYLALALIFTLVGQHGTIYHTAGGLMPFQAGAAMAAFDGLAGLYARRRKNIKAEQLRLVLVGVVLVINIALTLYVGYTELAKWNGDYNYGKAVTAWFQQNNIDNNVIIITEPLSYHYATGKTAIPLASDGVAANLAAAHKYGATYLALGLVHYDSLNQLYQSKQADGLSWLGTMPDGTQIYRINS